MKPSADVTAKQTNDSNASNIAVCQHYFVRILNSICLWLLRLFSSPIFIIWCFYRNANHHNYWLSLGLCINITTILVLSHFNDILSQIINITAAVEITIIAFWSCIVLFLCLDVTPSNDDRNNSETPSIPTVKPSESFELIQKNENQDIRQSMDDDDWLSAPVANIKRKKRMKPKRKQTPNDVVLGLKLTKPQENTTNLNLEYVHHEQEQFERSLLGILVNDLKYIPDPDDINRIVLHYILLSIIISLTIGYITLKMAYFVGFDGFENNINIEIKTMTFGVFYETLGIVLANLVGGYKIVELITNWFMRQWKDPRIKDCMEPQISVSTPPPSRGVM